MNMPKFRHPCYKNKRYYKYKRFKYLSFLNLFTGKTLFSSYCQNGIIPAKFTYS